MKSRIIFAGVFFIFLLSGAAAAADNPDNNGAKNGDKPWVRKVAYGVLLHDVGLISDQRENGVDPNWEVQFNPPEWRWWRWVGSPLPYDRRHSELRRGHERFLSRTRLAA